MFRWQTLHENQTCLINPAGCCWPCASVLKSLSQSHCPAPACPLQVAARKTEWEKDKASLKKDKKDGEKADKLKDKGPKDEKPDKLKDKGPKDEKPEKKSKKGGLHTKAVATSSSAKDKRK